MYKECKDYLLDAIKAAGIKTNPYTSVAALSKCVDSRVGAVLFVSGSPERDGSKTYYTDQDHRKKRRKVFSRRLTFKVIIGGYGDEEVETIYENLLSHLDAGIYIDGNYTELNVGDEDWVEKDDSILRAKVAVEVEITFDGGLYKDTGFAQVADVTIDSVEKEIK